MSAPEIDRKLSQALLEHNRRFSNRYTNEARDLLLDTLFRALTNDRQDYLANLFPNGFPLSYSLRDAQGAEEEPEYTEAARGRACGHILKPGEATYHCATCTTDPTAVLCSRCWDASNHEDHQFAVSMSGGNSGCCDCGDDEAWKHPIKCAIHSLDARPGSFVHVSRDLPPDLTAAVRTTMSRVLDFFCDVISCAPENLRLSKSVEGVQQDERQSRLLDTHYGHADEVEAHPEYCLVMWNDEKHTITEVQHQVMKACRTTGKFGLEKAGQAHDHGRSILTYSRDVDMLLRQAKIIEHIKITVTVRSARDTFREQMCGTIIEWLDDIAACSIMGNATLLRDIICEEMLNLWRIGSGASNAKIGRQGLDDHEREEFSALRPSSTELPDPLTILLQRNQQITVVDEDDLSSDDEDDDDMPDLEPIRAGDRMIARFTNDLASDGEEMDTDGDNDFPDANETLEPAEDVPPPPPPPIVPQAVTAEPVIATATDDLSRPGSEATSPAQNPNFRNIPKTPTTTVSRKTKLLETSHWRVGLPIGSNTPGSDEPAWKDLKQNIRLDSMVLFDLRLWKSVRTSLRELLITTVINVPRFKRILAFRFAGLYTTLAQLFLVADREPDHSILHVSVQLLNTPSIAEEVVQSANFLTVLIAILYTYLTTRQVGFPEDVDPGASLGFDAGSVSNRRLYQFFNDLRYFLATPAIKSRMRHQGEYLLQFLDLAKLSQGICPNVRAVGDHVEYETDAWISAQLLIREINRLCKQITEPYQPQPALKGPDSALIDAIDKTLKSAIVVCSGLEHQRFEQSEIKGIVKFHRVGPFSRQNSETFETVNFSVEKGTLSFHHPLHYTLSWLLENGKDSPQYIDCLREVAQKIVDAFKASPQTGGRFALQHIYETGEDALMAVFDYPLRVCAWLAQMRANMWVRNGMSLRHQMNQYKGVNYRDMGYYRDLFLLQTALVACRPERVLASIIDRFGLNDFIKNANPNTALGVDQGQQLDIAEDFVYLLINLLSDRDLLCAHPDDPASELIVLRKDIAHTLCFKPLSYTDLTNRLTERAENHPSLQKVIAEMTNFKAPEGLHDSGAFELKPEFLQELDPYNSHFSKNQRDEAENIYKKWAAKKLNKSTDDIVLEPKLHSIKSVAYKSLPEVIHGPLFTITMHALLVQLIALSKSGSSRFPPKAESFLNTVLHLLLIASMEDNSAENEVGRTTFILNAIELKVGETQTTVLSHLHTIWNIEELSSARSKIKHILRIFHKKCPSAFNAAAHDLDFDAGRFDTASPAVVEQELEAKKKQAMERKAKIMAQMQQQQQNFMDKQGVIDWGDDDMSDTESEIPTSTETRHWKAPSGVCIQCREETNDERLYGTFAMVTNAHLLRVTPTHSVEHIMEVLASPPNLDQSIEASRPFGVAGNNLEKLRRFAADGSMSTIERRGLSVGWPRDSLVQGLLSTSCGHFMHYACFENYYKSIDRRHVAQISRCQPERTVQNEFVCPLCKALANAFLPVSQKSTEQSYPSVLHTESSFEFFLEDILPASQTAFENLRPSENAVNDTEAGVHTNTISSFTTNALAPFARALLENRELPHMTGMLEMGVIYKRLKETIDLVWKTQIDSEDQSVEYQSRFIAVLANSVSAVEIAHRGRDDNSTCLIDHIAAQTLSHLQVLSQSVLAGAATMATVGNNFHRATPLPLRPLYDRLADQLYGNSGSSLLAQDGFTTFVGMSLISSKMQSLPVAHLLRVCLTQEILRIAIWWLQFGAPAVKSHAATLAGELKSPKSPGLSREEYSALGGFVYWLTTSIHGERIQPLLPVDEVAPLYTAMRAYALAFMRKAALFLHVAHGVDFPDATAALSGKPELDRLLSLTKLPDLTTILSSFSEFTTETALPNLAQRWIKAWTGPANTRHAQSSQLLVPRNTSAASMNQRATISLYHPAPFELVGLPEHYDTLIAEAQKRRCPTTGKEIIDAALCLFCGEIFCSQAVCCMHDGIRGGCNHHIEMCSAPIGMFLFIRKCNVVFLDCRKDPRKIDRLRAQQARERHLVIDSITPSSGPSSPTSDSEDRSVTPTPGEAHSPATTISRFSLHTPSEVSLSATSNAGTIREADITDAHGAFFAAPYLTKHGETDQGLRTRQQLVLSKKRYDRLVRDAWLCVNGSVWSAVARKLEGESNAGGWETL